jgi:hypothetical protein
MSQQRHVMVNLNKQRQCQNLQMIYRFNAVHV